MSTLAVQEGVEPWRKKTFKYTSLTDVWCSVVVSEQKPGT